MATLWFTLLALDPPVPPAVADARTNLVRLGASAVLDAGAGFSLWVHNQWFHNGAAIEGATNRTLTISSVSEADAGVYTLSLSNIAGNATSAPIHLTVVPPGPLDRSEWLHPAPQGNDIRAGAYGNGLCVLGASRGTILISTNARDWTVRHFEALGEIQSIAFGQGLFALAATRGTFVSSNLTTWTRTGPAATAVSYGNGTFVAIRESGISTSPDGMVWTDHHGQLEDEIVFGNGVFVALRPVPGRRVCISTNGIEWYSPPINHWFERVRFGNGVFIAFATSGPSLGSQPFISENGRDWFAGEVSSNRLFLDVAAGPAGFIAVGEEGEGEDSERARIFHSDDGLVWNTTDFRSGNNLQFALAAGRTFIAAGDDGNLAISDDGKAWEAVVAGSDLNLRSIVRGGNGYVVTGQEGTILFSEDGRNWATAALLGANNTLVSAAYGNGRYVVAGGAGLFISDDAYSWQSVGMHDSVQRLLFAENRFVGVGLYGTVITSADGREWEEHGPFGLDSLLDVAYGSGRWVAVGVSGTILVSTNLSDWKRQPRVTQDTFLRIGFGNGRFVTVSAAFGGGSNWVSSDGLAWTLVSRFPGTGCEALTFGSGRFVAADSLGRLFSSEDGVLWVEHAAITQNRVRGLTFADGAFFIVGNNLSILRSGQIYPKLGIGNRNEELIEIEIESGVGTASVLEFSSDLFNWTPLIQLPPDVGRTNIVDTGSAAVPRRFYRVKH